MKNEKEQDTPITKTKDRSPGFPFISLQAAIERLAQFDKIFGRHPTPADKAGLAWEMKLASSQANQTLAALKHFGLVDYDGLGKDRKAVLTEDGRNYLRAQQDDIKKEILKRVALKPKEIAKFWDQWGADRPHDAVCLDTLVLKHKYNDNAAPIFLKVYDDTIAFAGLSALDKNDSYDEDTDQEDIVDEKPTENTTNKADNIKFQKTHKISLSNGERILQDGILSQNATYRIIVSGKVGPKEIERLIKKLELDKEILAESPDDDSDLV